MDACSPCAREGFVAAQPAKKREMDDNSKRLASLLYKMNEGEVTPGVVEALQQMGQALAGRDLALASKIQIKLSTTDWNECSNWLQAIRRLLKVRQTS